MDNDDGIIDIDFLGDMSGDDRLPVKLVTDFKFVILSIASFGLFEVWWMYRVWTFYRNRDGSDIWPVARAIFSVVFFYNLVSQIKDDAIEANWKGNYMAGLLTLAFILFTLLSRLPDPFWYISFGQVVLFILPVRAFNYYIQSSIDYEAVIQISYKRSDYIIVGIGGLVWAFILIGTFLILE